MNFLTFYADYKLCNSNPSPTLELFPYQWHYYVLLINIFYKVGTRWFLLRQVFLSLTLTSLLCIKLTLKKQTFMPCETLIWRSSVLLVVFKTAVFPFKSQEQ